MGTFHVCRKFQWKQYTPIEPLWGASCWMVKTQLGGTSNINEPRRASRSLTFSILCGDTASTRLATPSPSSSALAASPPACASNHHLTTYRDPVETGESILLASIHHIFPLGNWISTFMLCCHRPCLQCVGLDLGNVDPTNQSTLSETKLVPE